MKSLSRMQLPLYLVFTIEYIVKKEIGKMTANIYMMRFYMSLYDFINIMQNSDAWLNSFILVLFGSSRGGGF